MSLDAAALKLTHHSKCHHVNSTCRRRPGQAEPEIRFFTKYHLSTKQTAESGDGSRRLPEWVFLEHKICFSDYTETLHCLWLSHFNLHFFSIKYSPASLLLDDTVMGKGTTLRVGRRRAKSVNSQFPLSWETRGSCGCMCDMNFSFCLDHGSLSSVVC